MSERLVQTRVGSLKVTLIGERAHRPTALLWHSLFVDERSWERVTPSLTAARQLVVVTGPGHGTSGDNGRRYSMEDCAEAALQVLQAVGAEGPVDWVGNAWGGHVGIVVAARHPDRVRTLITAGSPIHPYPLADKLTTQLLVFLYRRLGPIRYLTSAVVDALLSERTRTTDPVAVDLVRDCFVRADRTGLANAIVSISLHRKDLKPMLPAVQAPTLFITGSAHPDWTPEQMRAAAALLPHGFTRVVDGAAYLVPFENPVEFTRDVHEFWAATPPNDTSGTPS
ncbi:MAG TPA: alpha/beta hydrolase [Arachnia sp.]|nr:alpha/beta hydrolase [Arachnia sp.]